MCGEGDTTGDLPNSINIKSSDYAISFTQFTLGDENERQKIEKRKK
jgi:hypothetical protein